MASAGRSLKGATLRFPNSARVCRLCREQSLQPKFTTVQQQRFASRSDIPYTEKLRRKIWGTDTPPGLADPYGGPSFLEKRKMRREAERRGQPYIEEPRARETQLPPQEDNISISVEQYPATRTGQAPTIDSQLSAGSGHLRYGIGEPQTDELLSVQSPKPPMETYIPADTVDGLEEVGRSGQWSDRRTTSQDQYRPWLSSPSQPAETRSQLLSCLHRAIVECFTEGKTNEDPRSLSSIGCSVLERENHQKTQTIVSSGLSVSALPVTIVRTDVPGSLQSTEQASEPMQGVDTDGEMGTTQCADESLQERPSGYYAVSDESFLSARLDASDPVTFTILKRFSQLSGRRIPDPILSATGTDASSIILSNLLDSICNVAGLSRRKTVAQTLLRTDALAGLGNVTVMPRRESPVDKEKDIGRWKVIERELKDRGLPVLGKLHA